MRYGRTHCTAILSVLYYAMQTLVLTKSYISQTYISYRAIYKNFLGLTIIYVIIVKYWALYASPPIRSKYNKWKGGHTKSYNTLTRMRAHPCSKSNHRTRAKAFTLLPSSPKTILELLYPQPNNYSPTKCPLRDHISSTAQDTRVSHGRF